MTQQSGIKKMILRELAKHKIGLTNIELSEKLGLTRQQVSDSLRESVGNGYVLKGENLGIEGINYTIANEGLAYLGVKLKVGALKIIAPAAIEKIEDAVKKVSFEPHKKSNTTEKIDTPPVVNEPLTAETDKRIYPFVTDSVVDDEPAAKPICDIAEQAFTPISDEINNPSHYRGETMGVIDVIDDFLTPKMVEGYLIGNVLKYVLRYQKKGGIESLKKAQWYLNRAVTDLESC